MNFILPTIEAALGAGIALGVQEVVIKGFVVKRTQILSKRVLRAALGLIDDHIFDFGITEDLDQVATSILESLMGPGDWDSKLALEQLWGNWSLKKYTQKSLDKVERLKLVPLEVTEYGTKKLSEVAEFASALDPTYGDEATTDTNTTNWWFHEN